MCAIPLITTDIKPRAPAIFKFLDGCSAAFEWVIVASFSGILLLSLIYSIVPPPLHPFGVPIP